VMVLANVGEVGGATARDGDLVVYRNEGRLFDLMDFLTSGGGSRVYTLDTSGTLGRVAKLDADGFSYFPPEDVVGLNADTFDWQVSDLGGPSSIVTTTVSILDSVFPQPVDMTYFGTESLVPATVVSNIVLQATDMDSVSGLQVFIVSLPYRGDLFESDQVGVGDKFPITAQFDYYQTEAGNGANFDSFQFAVVDPDGHLSLRSGVATISLDPFTVPPVIQETVLLETSDQSTVRIIFNVSNPVGLDEDLRIFVGSPAVGELVIVNSGSVYDDNLPVVWEAVCGPAFCLDYVVGASPDTVDSFQYAVSNLAMVANNIEPVEGTYLIDIQSDNMPPTLPSFQRISATEDDCPDGFSTCPALSCYSLADDFGLSDDRDPVSDLTVFVTSLPTRGILYRAVITRDVNGTIITCARATTEVEVGDDLGTAASVAYQPPADESGAGLDRFQFAAEDLQGAVSDPCIAIIDVIEVNDAPVANPNTISTRQNRPVQIALTGFDREGDEFTPIVTVLPSSGFLTQEDGTPIDARDTVVTGPLQTVIYTPENGVVGEGVASFRFILVDEKGASSSSARIGIDVRDNTRPQPISSVFEGFEDTPLTLQLEGRDTDGDELRVSITVLPFRGRLYQCLGGGSECVQGEEIVILGERANLTDPGNRAVYVPQQDDFGTPFDSLEIVVEDDLSISRTSARCTINIAPEEDDPIARDVNLIPQREDTDVGIILAGFDPDPGETESLRAFIASLPEHGILLQADDLIRQVGDGEIVIDAIDTEVTNPNRKVIYRPDLNFNSGILLDNPDFFDFYLIDVTGRRSNTASVEILIVEVNDDPVAINDTLNVDQGVNTLITLQTFDVDQTCATCTGTIISRVPQQGELFQADSSGQKFAPIGTGGTVIISLENKVIFDSKKADGDSVVTFEFLATDERGGRSEPALVTLNIGPQQSSSSGGGATFVAAGAAAGVAVICCCLCFGIWYYRRRQRNRERSLADYLYGRKTSTELLEKLLLEEDMLVVSAMAEEIPITEADEMGEALCVIYQANDCVMRLLKKLIRDEIRESDAAGTLFRGNSIASKTMKAYSKLIGLEYLRSTLAELTEQVLSNPGAYEVDPRKLPEGDSLDENWERLKEVTQQFLDAIIDSKGECPPEFRELCHFMLTEIETKFPDFKNAITYVGGFIFLRFFVPAMVAPEGYKVIDEVPDQKSRRGLILVSKGLQNLSNGVQFGNKEAYMMPMNEFIIRNLHGVREFLEEIANVKNVEDAEDTFVEIDNVAKQEALSSCHRLLFVNQEPVKEWLENEQGDDDSKEKAGKPLEEFNRLMDDYKADDYVEVTEVLLSEPAIIAAFCNTIQTVEIAQSLITMFESKQMTVEIMRNLIVAEVNEGDKNPNMLLRGNNTAFKMLKGYVEILGLDYLNQTLGMMVKFVNNNPEGYDINPNRCPDMDEDELEERVQKLTEIVNEFWDQIVGSVDNMPLQIRFLCRQLQVAVEEKYPERKYQVIGEFFFNRLICPAISTPVSYGLMDEEPSLEARQVLILISNVLLNIVRGTQVSKKHPWLDVMGDIVLERQDSLQAFLDNLCFVTEGDLEDVQSAYEITPDLLAESAQNVYRKMEEDRMRITALLTPDLRETGNVADRLEAILKDLGLPASKKRVQAASPR